MKINLIDYTNNWKTIKNAALTTADKNTNNEPNSEWKRKILLSEHSPIRLLRIHWKWFDLKYWISVHFCRHKFGIEHWVQSQRPDRGKSGNRDDDPQSTLINHEAEANAQAIINISRKRLCLGNPMPETREAWKAFVESFKDIEPELYRCCVKDCIYRGWCYEYKSCGYHKTNKFQEELNEYRENINI